MIGIGPSSMNRIGDYYFQNVYALEDYCAALRQDKFPTLRGYKVNDDEKLRRDVMYQILCYFEVVFNEVERKHGIVFQKYFDRELAALQELVKDGIVAIRPDSIVVTPLGRFFLRHICRVFDALGKDYKHSRETVKQA